MEFWLTYKEYKPCCTLNMLLKHFPLSVIMKVMKYSMQPVLFKDPLKDFLDIFGDLDFLEFNNLNQGDELDVAVENKKKSLMERNRNPKVLMCQYARQPVKMIGSTSDGSYNVVPKCNLFHLSLTNGGFGYTFNQANFWDMYSSTQYTEEFAKIYRPKGHKIPNSHNDYSNTWTDHKDNIFYPIQSGEENGLTVFSLNLSFYL